MTRAAKPAPVATPRGLPLRVLLVLLEYARNEHQTMRLVAHEISRRWAPIQGTCFASGLASRACSAGSLTHMHGRLTRVGEGDEIGNKARRHSRRDNERRPVVHLKHYMGGVVSKVSYNYLRAQEFTIKLHGPFGVGIVVVHLKHYMGGVVSNNLLLLASLALSVSFLSPSRSLPMKQEA